MTHSEQVVLEPCHPIPFDFHFENKRAHEISVEATVIAGPGVNLPFHNGSFSIAPFKDKIVPSSVHLQTEQLEGDNKVGIIKCRVDFGETIERELHSVSRVTEGDSIASSAAAARVIIKAGWTVIELHNLAGE